MFCTTFMDQTSNSKQLVIEHTMRNRRVSYHVRDRGHTHCLIARKLEAHRLSSGMELNDRGIWGWGSRSKHWKGCPAVCLDAE